MDDETLDKHLEIVRKVFRDKFEAGDKLALLDCIRWCSHYKLPFPGWALSVLSGASGKYLKGASSNFHDALFGARRELGRHSNAATRRRESHELLFDIVTALRNHGYRGDALWARSRELLQKLMLTPDRELRLRKRVLKNVPEVQTIKKRFERMTKDGMRSTGFAHMIPWFVKLENQK